MLPPVAERHGRSSRTAAAATCQRAGGYGADLGTLAAAAAALVMARGGWTAPRSKVASPRVRLEQSSFAASAERSAEEVTYEFATLLEPASGGCYSTNSPTVRPSSLLEGLLHVWEAELRNRRFGRASRELGVPLTAACGLAAFPQSVRCTRAQSAGASQQRASQSEQALERERYTQLREGCRKSRRGRRSTVIDELAAAAARFAAQRAWCRAQQSNPLHPQGWHAWMWPLTSCSSCAVDVSH